MAQHFVGGALSGYAGFSSNAKMAKPMTVSYLKVNAHNIFAKYGTQSTLSDFAYDEDRKFFKKNLTQHFGTFVTAGLGGVMQELSMNNPLVDRLSFLPGLGYRFGASLGSYYLEYQSTSAVKANFYGLESKGLQAKMGVSGYKSMFNVLMISLQ